MSQKLSTDSDLVRTAQITGLLYLVIIIGAGFAEGVVRGGLVTPGDAQATAQAISANPGLFRLGLVGDLVAFLADTAVAVLLYVLLRSVNQTVALVAAAFRLVAHPAIAAVNLLNHQLGGMLADGGGALGAFSPDQLDAMTSVAMELHGYGYLLGGAFFGVHMVLLGWLLVRSVRFPGWLGWLVGVAGVTYLAETFAHFGVPALADAASATVVVAASIGEVTLCLWLLIRGVRTVQIE